MSEYRPAYGYGGDHNGISGASSSTEEHGVPFFEAAASYGEEMSGRLDMAFKYIEHDDPGYPARVDESVLFVSTAFEAMADDILYEADREATYYFADEIADDDARQFVYVGESYDLAAAFVGRYREQLNSDYLHQNVRRSVLLAKTYGSCGTILHKSAERSRDVVGDSPQVRQDLEDAGKFYHKAIGQLLSCGEEETTELVDYYGQQALLINEILGGESSERNARFLGRIIDRYGR